MKTHLYLYYNLITMKQLILILTLLPFFTFCNEENKKIKEIENNLEGEKSNPMDQSFSAPYHATYYLIRHAEKVRSNPQNQDPSLDQKGLLRAKRWAAYFEPIEIDEIYTTNYIRTNQTISVIAEQKTIVPKNYDPDKIYSDGFLKETDGKNILIVGHSNTIPYFVNKLLDEEKFTEMDDGDNSTLFKVTINGKDKKVETITVE